MAHKRDRTRVAARAVTHTSRCQFASRTIHVAAAASPRFVPTDYPRRGRGVAATLLQGISTSRPRRRRDSPPRTLDPQVAPLSETFFFFTSNCFEDAVVEAHRHRGDDAAALRRDLEASINDAPRLPCSAQRRSPFEDASLRSRLGKARQWPFAPLNRQDLAKAVDGALEAAAKRHNLGELAWSPDLSDAYAASHAGDARAAAAAAADDLEAAAHFAPFRVGTERSRRLHLLCGRVPELSKFGDV